MDFTDRELTAIQDQEFFLIKSSATKKVIDLFGKMELELKSPVAQFDPGIQELNRTTGKIFRGENYKLYPYVVLDYPKLFSVQSVFAFRTMFWWGHEFSFTLHLQGNALDRFRATLLSNLNLLTGNQVYYCINDSPWHYSYSDTNYRNLEDVKEIKQDIERRRFVKLSRRLPLTHYAEAVNYCVATFRLFLSAIDS